MIYDDQLPECKDLFLRLPHFDGILKYNALWIEVSTCQHLSLLWYKLQQCCVHLPSEAYINSSTEAEKQKECLSEIITQCRCCLYESFSLPYEI